ncbi:MAG: cache domain-containing protein, partial [Burkholderiales bacterium]
MVILRSLRARAMLSVAVVLLLILGIAVYRAYERRGADIAVTYTQLKQLTASIAARHAEVLRSTYTFVDAMLTDLDVAEFGAGRSCSDAMAELLAREPRYDNIGLASPAGNTACNGRHNPPLDLSGEAYFQQALRDSATVVSGVPLLAPGTGNWVLPFARAVRGENGTVEAVFVATVSLANLVDESARSQPLESIRIGLVNADGLVLAHYPEPGRMVGQNISAEPFFQAMLAAGGEGSAEAPGLDGAPRIFAFTRLPETTNAPVYA